MRPASRATCLERALIAVLVLITAALAYESGRQDERAAAAAVTASRKEEDHGQR